VTLQFAPGTAFIFQAQASWPRSDDYTLAIERTVREVLSNHGVLHSTQCTLLCIDWDEISSCESGFAAAARAATVAALEV
jgi:hypothetical protein